MYSKTFIIRVTVARGSGKFKLCLVRGEKIVVNLTRCFTNVLLKQSRQTMIDTKKNNKRKPLTTTKESVACTRMRYGVQYRDDVTVSKQTDRALFFNIIIKIITCSLLAGAFKIMEAKTGTTGFKWM